MSLATTISAMVAAGCTAQQLEAVVLAHEADAAKRVAEKRAKDADRQRRHRSSRNVTVTPSDCCDTPSLNDVQPNPVNVQVNLNPPHYSPPALKNADDAFGGFWSAFPKRQGGNSRKNAEARFRSAVKAGVSAETIIDGARRYAEHCDATDKTGTEFVKTAEAWLNGRFWESDWSISLSRPAPPHRQAKRNTALDDLNFHTDRMEFGNVQQFPRLIG